MTAAMPPARQRAVGALASGIATAELHHHPRHDLVEAVLWMARAGCAWRLVPDAVGRWNSVYRRFARWQEKGVWQALLDHLAADADLEWVMLDGTVVRAHACADGAKNAGEQALGRSRGGFSSKQYPAGDALGNPLAFRLTAGQQGDAPQALFLLDRRSAQAMIADRAYDTDAILAALPPPAPWR